MFQQGGVAGGEIPNQRGIQAKTKYQQRHRPRQQVELPEVLRPQLCQQQRPQQLHAKPRGGSRWIRKQCERQWQEQRQRQVHVAKQVGARVVRQGLRRVWVETGAQEQRGIVVHRKIPLVAAHPHHNQQPNAEQPPSAAWHALRALRPHEQTAHHPARTCLQAAFAKPRPQRLMVDGWLLVKGERTLNAALPGYMVGSDVRILLILRSMLRYAPS